ncbi:MAG: hypothetical protein K9J12_03840 [Melioribacteraceae bacterium]|nr:hypothetical protein [Melioribacteraceae bacterium]MCF8263231.1 hypothetical protein [Melioribacteraceae bacterium]MCF8412205.1 hypothetical protein [Melioribacteraceae bacterium]MCF8431019.1 hypothetical protein [Melioribacteraceae bacterium]
MKNLLVILFLLIAYTLTSAQEVEVTETEIEVSGVCGMCKERIEKSIDIDQVKYTKWNKRNKMLFVAFESTVTADSLMKRIAAIGHDTELFKAPDEVYNSLPKCCRYREDVRTH